MSSSNIFFMYFIHIRFTSFLVSRVPFIFVALKESRVYMFWSISYFVTIQKPNSRCDVTPKKITFSLGTHSNIVLVRIECFCCLCAHHYHQFHIHGAESKKFKGKRMNNFKIKEPIHSWSLGGWLFFFHFFNVCSAANIYLLILRFDSCFGVHRSVHLITVHKKNIDQFMHSQLHFSYAFNTAYCVAPHGIARLLGQYQYPRIIDVKNTRLLRFWCLYIVSFQMNPVNEFSMSMNMNTREHMLTVFSNNSIIATKIWNTFLNFQMQL